MTWPTMLLGVEAPAVSPMISGPVTGSQSGRDVPRRRRPSTAAPIGRCRISVGRHAGIADRRCGTSARARRRCAPDCRCCCCCSRRSRPSGRAAVASSSATTASCRSCVALQIVSNARKRVASAGLAVAVRHRAAATSRRSPATRSSASSSGWRSRCASRCAIGIEARRDRLAETRDERGRVAAVTDELADDVGFGLVAHDEVVPARILRRLRRRRARLLVVTLPWMTDVNPSCA